MLMVILGTVRSEVWRGCVCFFFFFSSRRRHTRWNCDWSSDVCSSDLLYNLHVAKHAMRKAERAILVEGYFDVLRVSLAGIEEVVAPLGTGLTAEQAQLVKRHTAHLVLLYDSDDAGLRATFRAGDELLRQGLRVSVATLPPGDDPDTLVQRHGAARLEEL